MITTKNQSVTYLNLSQSLVFLFHHRNQNVHAPYSLKVMRRETYGKNLHDSDSVRRQAKQGKAGKRFE